MKFEAIAEFASDLLGLAQIFNNTEKDADQATAYKAKLFQRWNRKKKKGKLTEDQFNFLQGQVLKVEATPKTYILPIELDLQTGKDESA